MHDGSVDISTLSCGSIFSGMGGFDLAAEAAGFKVRWQVEIDSACCDVLRYRWPDVVRHVDVMDVSGSELEPVDVVVFGSPCQDLSNVGRRDVGLDGAKSGMFFEAVRIVREMKETTNGRYPKWVVWENVAGAVHSRKGRDFAVAVQSFINLGTLVLEWSVLDSQFFGVAQRRRRLFLVACLDDAAARRCGPEILPLGACVPRDSEPDLFTFYSTHGKMDEPSWGIGATLKAKSVLCVVGQVVAPRKLTPVEHERLQGWPDDHTKFGITESGRSVVLADSTRYRALGNGIAVPVASWVLRQVRRTL